MAILIIESIFLERMRPPLSPQGRSVCEHWASVVPTFPFFASIRLVILTIRENNCTIPWVFYAVGMIPLRGFGGVYFLVRSEALDNFLILKFYI